MTQSYDLMWWISIVLACSPALINLPISESSVARLRPAAETVKA